MNRLLGLIFVIFCSNIVLAQSDSILFMNGKIKLIKIDSVNNFNLFYTYKSKEKSITRSKVFSYSSTRQNSILYSDRSIDYLSQEQMRTLIIGKQIGLAKYDNKGIIISSFVLSLASSLFDTYESINDVTKNPDFTSSQFSSNRFFAREPTFAQILMPLTYTFTITAFRPKLKSKHLQNQSFLQNELIIEGFQTTAKRKKFYGAMFSGVTGTIVGMISYVVFKP